jgi:hypothetical protein
MGEGSGAVESSPIIKRAILFTSFILLKLVNTMKGLFRILSCVLPVTVSAWRPKFMMKRQSENLTQGMIAQGIFTKVSGQPLMFLSTVT